ncbi:MAG: rhomboid family intramembrane serine protease [Rhodomicrobium sp.]|nr:rhomboid family intramembrane serine protease [Rhodomicrobium sp.]
MHNIRETRPESLAVYLAKTLIVKKGYHAGAVPEARELSEHCDFVLTRANGLTLEIVAIVDRQRDPARKFGLTKAALEKIGTACLRYTGKAGFRKLPVTIMIIETGTAIPPEETARLKLLKSRSPFAKVLISAWALDEAAQEVWTNAPFRGRFSLSPFLKGLMTKPRLAESELMPKPAAALPEHRPLYLTYCLLAAIAAVFIGEYVFRIGPASGLLDPSIITLIALGALDKTLIIEGGEWWRLFSAPLLHGGLIHIALNGVALFFAGAVLENVIGRAWFAAVFAVSGIAGALMSLLINPQALISVGASGAIMGMFGAAFAVSYRYPTASPMRTFLQSGSLRMLIPSLIPLFGDLFGQKIDFAAHIGGAIGGAVIGALLVVIWQRDELLPPYRKLALGLAAAVLCGTLYSGVQIASGHDQYDPSSNLIPDQQMPKDIAAVKEKSASLIQSYPRDPRSHMYRALALMDAGDTLGAEREWRAALADGKMLRLFFQPQLEQFIRANLAITLKENGKGAEARAVAQPVCGTKGEIRDGLAKQGLCPE